MTNFDSNPTNIGEFFNQKDTIFRVPPYQREYSWSEENIETLLEDLFSGESYFLGTFVLNTEHYKQGKYKDIVDGQQRILTITIFFSVIRDLFLELKDKKRSALIQSKYLSDKDDDDKDNFKVVASSSARLFFEKYIQKENNKIEESILETKEHKRIFDAYQKIKQEILLEINKLDSNNKKLEKLSAIREDLKNLELIVIEVGSEEDAFTFFETLNSRGTDLSQSDLIKNFIFSKISKENKDIEVEWQKIKDALTIDDSAEITTFLRHYWLSTRKKITENKLFKAIKKETIDNYEKFLETLVQESLLYSMIISPNISDWKKEHIDIFKTLNRLQALNVKQSRSIILTLLRMVQDDSFWNKYGTIDIKKTLFLIENFTFAFSTISKKSPSALENIYSKYSILLNKEYISSNKHSKANIEKILKEFKGKISEIYPSEHEFKDNFSKIEYKQSVKQIALIKYIIEKINYKSNTEQVFDHVTLEHILPQNPDSEWGITKDEISSYVNNIGNIIPLGLEYNQKASNYILKKKIDMYNESQISMTRELVENFKRKNSYTWSKIEIDNRNTELSSIAWNIWGKKENIS